MYLLNSITPMLNEDYFAAFVWPEGIPNLGTLPDNAKRVSSFSDVLENCRVYYLTEGGRVPGGVPGTIFSWLGKVFFNPLNALAMTILVMEIYWLSHEGKVSFDFQPSYLIWIFFSLWAFNLAFTDTCLWMSGSSNYLWMIVIVFAFLIPYVRNYYDEKWSHNNSFKLSVIMFINGLLAGWSHETTICWLILILLYWLYQCKKHDALQNWKITGFAGLSIGYALLIFAPGNYYRLAMQQQTNNAIGLFEIYSYKLTEILWILIFHSFLWYFIISFLLRSRKIHVFQDRINSYINLATVCSLIAFGSGFIMFLLPASVLRPSFLNLVFLIVAAASLFRAQEIAQKSFLQKNVKSFLQLIGGSYVILTMTISLWCNYINWNHWNDIIALIHKEQKNPTNVALQVEPYYTDAKTYSRFARGFHLIPMPVVCGDENDRINVTLAKYYDIKGIAIKQR